MLENKLHQIYLVNCLVRIHKSVPQSRDLAKGNLCKLEGAQRKVPDE